MIGSPENHVAKLADVTLNHPRSWYDLIFGDRVVFTRNDQGDFIQVNFVGEQPRQYEDGSYVGSVFESGRHGDGINRYSYIYDDGRVKTQEFRLDANGDSIETKIWLDDTQITELYAVLDEVAAAA